MINLGIPEIFCLQRKEDTEKRSIKYDAVAAKKPQNCPNIECDSNTGKIKPENIRQPHIHSRREHLLQDINAEGKLVYINLETRRYRCPHCGYVFPDEFTFYKKRSRLTNRLKDEFVRRCLNGETFSYIARDYSLDHKTISVVFKEYAEDHKDLYTFNYTPEILGIDEAHIDDNYRLILTDVKMERLLDMKKDRRKPTVKAYLRTLDKDICKCATMDFWPAFASAVHEVLPETVIVVDKFHVIQEINRCLDQVRITIQNKLRKQGVDIAQFKHSKRLFQMNFEDLSDEAERTLSKWFSEYDELYEAYMCKETFRDIYALASDKEEAAALFGAWIKGVPEYEQFSAMKKTFSERKDHILNYWDYPVTNAYTESVNNRIKSIEKAGRGYKFENLRVLCLLGINKQKQDKFDPRTAEYHPVDRTVLMVNETAAKYSVSRKQRLYQIPVQFDYVLREKRLLIEYLDVNVLEKSRSKRMKIYAERLLQLKRAGD